MAVKAVEMVRKIRDKHYGETKDLSVAEQIRVVKEMSGKLKKQLKAGERSTKGKAAQTNKDRVA